MTAEQLQTARAAAWRQAGNPILTADDATAWLRETGLCLFLPRPAQIAAPAPSFVEATLGESSTTPAPASIEAATELILRLLSQGEAVALNLMGATTSQPDFLATPETLPFVYALRGDKEWKRGPRGKSSPLVVEVWKLLEKEGPLTAAEVKDLLGRELTEAAALRALAELWNTLRIEPVYRDYASLADPARWQPLDRRYAKQLQAGATMSAGMAISALVSLYLQSSIAATEEEVEAFLSPLCSRSKVRDAVRGLSATRQLASVHIGGAELYHVEGALPEFPAVEVLAPTRPAEIEVLAAAEEAPAATGPAAATEAAAASEEPAGSPTPPPRKKPGGLVRRSFAFRGEGKSDDEGRKPFTGARRPGGTPGSSARPGGRTGERAAGRTMGSSRPGSTTRRPSTPGGAARKPYGTRSVPPAGFNATRPWEEDRKPRPAGDPPRESERHSPGDAAKRPDERKSTGGGSFGTEKHFGGKKQFGGKKTFGPGRGAEVGSGRKPDAGPGRSPEAGAGRGAEERGRASGTSRPFKPAGERPFPPRSGAGRPFSGDRRPAFGARGERPSGDRKPFSGGSPRKPFTPRADQAGNDRRPAFGAGRPFQPRGDRPFPARAGSPAPRPGAGGRSDAKPGFGGSRKPFSPGSQGSSAPPRKPWADRDNSAGASETGRKAPYPPRRDRPSSPGGGRPASDRPYSSRGPGRPFDKSGPGRPFDRTGAPPRSGSSYGRMDGGRPRPASGGGPDRPAANRPFPARPSADRPRPAGAGKGPGGPKSRTSPFTSSGKPRPGVKPTGRPGPRANRAPGAPGRPNTGPKKSAGPRKRPEAE